MNELPGQLVYVFAVSIVDAALLAWLALLWYRRTVRRLMRGGADAVPIPSEDHRTRSAHASEPAAAPDIQLVEERRSASGQTSVDRRAAAGRVVLAYCLGAAAYAATVTTLKFAGVSPPLPPAAWLADSWTHAWPIIPTCVALLVLNRRRMLRLVLLYLGGGAIAIALLTAAGQLLRGTLNSAPITNVFWALALLGTTAPVPLAIVALTGWRRVRAVMPLAVAATLLFALAMMFLRELLVRALSLETFRSLFLGAAERTSPAIVHYGLFLILCLPVGWVAWRLLTLIANAFARKAFSDVQVAIDCWWAVAAAEVTVTTLVIEHGAWGLLGGAAAFAAYRLTLLVALRGYRPPDAAAGRRLLLLRVFGYDARTESLFDRVAQAFRFYGPVQLIAGVDLAMRTVDPGDFMALLNGRLAEQYVRAPEEVPERLARLDLRPDPDGRFRINEVYCLASTWKAALQGLLDVTDAVLMDLRSFSPASAGCIFELEQLVRRLPCDNIVLVCDTTTDLPLLERTLRDAWSAARSEGTARGSGRISFVRVERNSGADVARLLQRLLEVGRPPYAVAAGRGA